MRAFLAGFFFALALWVTPAQAQFATNCPTQNTTVLTVGSALVLSNCRLNLGINNSVFVSATGEVTCGSNSDAAVFLVAGASTQPPLGANFTGSISGGVLTVSAMITSPPYSITAGANLFDATSGTGIPNSVTGSTLTVTGQLTGTTGGVGTYSVSDNTVTVGSETMWSTNVYAVQTAPPSAIQISRDQLEHLACQNGKTFLVTLTGAVNTGLLGTSQFNIWAAVMLTSESLGGLNPKSASFNNGQITIFSPGAFSGWIPR